MSGLREDQCGFESYRVTVDYTREIDEYLSNGNFTFDYVDRRISSANFEPVFAHEDKKEIKLFLWKPGRELFGMEIKDELRALNFWTGTLWDLLALTENYPTLQDDFPIIALASYWRDRMGRGWVPVIQRGKKGRLLILHKAYFPWRRNSRFLASLVE